MAISEISVWEVRTTGHADNGGGFIEGASGTDYSQQDAAEQIYTDLVIDAATNTDVTSATRTFIAADIGNIIHITGGTGFTTGYFEITAVAAGVATLDRAVGTTSSTGGEGRLGGAMVYPGQPFGAVPSSADCTVWVKEGTYTMTQYVADVVGGRIEALANTIWISGYGTTRGDTGVATFDCTATLGTGATLIDVGSNKSALRNFNVISSNDASNSLAITFRGNESYGINISVIGHNKSILLHTGKNFLYDCYFADAASVTNPIDFGTTNNDMFNTCVFSGMAVGVGEINGGIFVNCIAKDSTGDGFEDGSVFYNCIAYNNAGDGFAQDDGSDHRTHYVNCVSVDNGAYGFSTAADQTSANSFTILQGCAGYNNTSGNLDGTFILNEGFVALTEQPFTDPTADPPDFSIATSELASKAYPLTFNTMGGNTGAYSGAVAASGSGGGGGGSNNVPGILFE